MELSKKYGIYIGTARGAVIYSNLDPKDKIKYDFAKEPSEISSMIWGWDENQIITGFKNGYVSFYDVNQQKYGKTLTKLKNKGAIMGLGHLDKNMIAASSKGYINILNSDAEFDEIRTNASEDSTLASFAQNMNKKNIVASGGEMHDLQLWDVETKKCVFKGKSLGHDHLNLPIRTSLRGITFIPEEQNVCVCASKEGYILLYDDRAQRKPVCKYFEEKASFTSIAPSYRQRNILAGTTKGYVQYIDMKAGKCVKTFTNIKGSVTCLICDPVDPVLTTVSLDRFIRIFNLDTKKMLHEQYLKQNLTKILMKPYVKEETPEELPRNDEQDEEYEDIFRNMEVITEKSSRKRNPASMKLKSKRIKK